MLVVLHKGYIKITKKPAEALLALNRCIWYLKAAGLAGAIAVIKGESGLDIENIDIKIQAAIGTDRL